MPPKSRSRTLRPQQSKLSFHGNQSKVTKPSHSQHKNIKANISKADVAEVTDVSQVSESAPSELDIVGEVRKEGDGDTESDPLAGTGASRTDDVLGGRAPDSLEGTTGGIGSGWKADEADRARGISDTHIKRYWRQKEQERLAPRIHQEDLDVYEKILREWDMSGQYGPCIGIARLKRWKRANLLGLDPPIEVLAVLLKEAEKGEVGRKSQQAYVDDLMNSHFVEA